MHVIFLPFSEQADDEVALELLVQDLREEVKVGNESGLQDNGDVGGVEELNWVWLLVALHLSAGNSEFHSEAL